LDRTSIGLGNFHNLRTDQELRRYFTTQAPAHEQIAARRYGEAAAHYRQLSPASETERVEHQSTARQLAFAQRMSDAGVRNVGFPPTERNVTDYFRTLRGRPMSEVGEAYREYASSFYVHAGNIGRGSVQYDAHRVRTGREVRTVRNPDSWQDITNQRELHSDGRRVIDCEGYAYLAQRAFSAAGFRDIQYAAARVGRDNPLTPDDERQIPGHIMLSVRRDLPDGRVELGVISNAQMETTTTNPTNFQSAEQRMLVSAFGASLQGHVEGGRAHGVVLSLHNTQWQASFARNRAMERMRSH
jgi:hypothetical protein